MPYVWVFLHTSMANLFKRIIHFLRRQLLRSSRFRWYAFTPQVSRETIAPLLGSYRFYAAGGPLMEQDDPAAHTTSRREAHRVSRKVLKANARIEQKRVVYVCNGRTVAGGLADRFKGILSLYAVCRELGYDFRICYTSPFRLEDYLQPAEHDWLIAPESLNMADSAMLVLENTEDSDYQTQRQAAWLRRRLTEGPAEMHVITNSNYAYTLDYAALFWRLFRFAPSLSAALESERQSLGRYITVNARFLSMLGDFQETGENRALPDDEAEGYIAATLREIERLHERHPDHVVLVNSDSMRFLGRARQFPYVRIVEGDVAHTDLMASDGAGAMHLKLFLDFFLIAYADEAYLLRRPPMRISGFPYAASRLSGRPFHIVEF